MTHSDPASVPADLLIGVGPLSGYERPTFLRALDILLAVALLALLAYTAYSGDWLLFAGIFVVTALSAGRDMILGFGFKPQSATARHSQADNDDNRGVASGG